MDRDTLLSGQIELLVASAERVREFMGSIGCDKRVADPSDHGRGYPGGTDAGALAPQIERAKLPGQGK